MANDTKTSNAKIKTSNAKIKTSNAKIKKEYEDLINRLDTINEYHNFMKTALDFVSYYDSVAIAKKKIMEVVMAATLKSPLNFSEELMVYLYDSIRIFTGDSEYDSIRISTGDSEYDDDDEDDNELGK